MPSASLPTLDFAQARRDPARAETLARDFDDALRGFGAFRARGLLEDPRLIPDQMDLTRRLFDVPFDELSTLHASGSVRRYASYPRHSDEPPELKHSSLTTVFGPRPEWVEGTVVGGDNRWPPSLPSIAAQTEAFDRAMLPCGMQIVGWAERALGLDPGALAQHFETATRYVRYHVYPPRDDDHIGCGAHCDHGAFTFLVEDLHGGLELQGPDGQWVACPPEPDTLIVFGGDLVERWTNGRWRASYHRARHPRHTHRYSCPYFFDPSWHAPIACLPSFCGPDQPPRVEPSRYCDLVLERWGAYA